MGGEADRARRRRQRAWALYDWASSSFMIPSFLAFPLLFHQVLMPPGAAPIVVGGWSLPRAAIWPYTVALAAFTSTAAVVPLALWGDRGAQRRRLFVALWLIGCVATGALALLPPGALGWGILVFVLAESAYIGSFTFYDAFLMMVAPLGERDRVSAWGVAAGYSAGVALLAIAGGLMRAIPGERGLRLAILFAAAWWLVFAIPLALDLPPEPPPRRDRSVAAAWRELTGTIRGLWRMPSARAYLLAILAGSQGMLTVFTQLAPYAQAATGATADQVAMVILLSQVAGGIGPFVTTALAARIGAIPTLMATYALWGGIALWGSQVRRVEELYGLALLAGIGLGGNLAIARSYYTRFFHREQATLWFTLSIFATRFGALLGPAVYGAIVQFTGSLRLGVLSVAGFFAIAVAALRHVSGAPPVPPAVPDDLDSG